MNSDVLASMGRVYRLTARYLANVLSTNSPVMPLGKSPASSLRSDSSLSRHSLGLSQKASNVFAYVLLWQFHGPPRKIRPAIRIGTMYTKEVIVCKWKQALVSHSWKRG